MAIEGLQRMPLPPSHNVFYNYIDTRLLHTCLPVAREAKRKFDRAMGRLLPVITFRFDVDNSDARWVDASWAAHITRAIKEGVLCSVGQERMDVHSLVDCMSACRALIPQGSDVDHLTLFPVYYALLHRALKTKALHLRILYDSDRTPRHVDEFLLCYLINIVSGRHWRDSPHLKVQLTIVTPTGRAQALYNAMVADGTMPIYVPKHVWKVEDEGGAEARPTYD